MRTDSALNLAMAIVLTGAMTGFVAQDARAQVLVNFDSFDAGIVPGGSVSGAAVDAYLAGYGITFSSSTSPAVLPAIQYAPADFSAGVRAPSSPNHFFGNFGTGSAYFYTLTFATPLVSFSFDTAATGSTSTMASWSATAYSAANAVLDSDANPSITGTNAPSATYTLTGSLIDHVEFMSNVQGFAGHQLAIDNLALTVPEPETYALLLAGLGLLGFAARRKARRAA